MKRKNMSRNALITSAIALLLCVSMLVGATFAWFTDEVVTGMNTIAAGNLDIELYANGKQVNSETKLFDDVTLWEPGVVVYENLQVANVGSLALKYQMTLNFGNENDLNGYKLSDVLQIAVIDKIADGATRAEVLAAAEGKGMALSAFNVTGSLEAYETSAEQTVVIFWAPNDNTIDNLYNANNSQQTSDGEALHIEFGIILQATQKMSEEDSFGNDYDGAAGWNTSSDTAWYSAEETEFVIYSAEELAGLAALVNGGETFAGKTVKLGSNIDLAGKQWIAIGNWDNAFEGTFDGQGYTINNLYINDAEGEGVGLFGVVQNATIKGVTINNLNITGYSMVAGVVGAAYPANVSDCHVTGSVKLVAEWAYVAGITGYNYYGTQIDGCSTVATNTGLIQSNTRNAVGGITAWLLEGDHKVTNCQVKNLDLVGWTNVGGITGFVHYNNTIDGCSVENVDLVKTRVDGNPGIGLIAGGWSYSASNAITLSNNTVKNATMEGTHIAYAAYNELYGSEYGGATTTNFVLENNTTENVTNNLMEIVKVNSAAQLETAVKDGATNLYLADGEYNVAGCGGKNLYLMGSKNAVLKVMNEGESGCDYGFDGATVTFNGLTIDTTANNGSYRGYARMNATYNDCNFVGAYTSFKTQSFNNCTFDFKGGYFWVWGAEQLTFNGCEFGGDSRNILAHGSASTVININNCTFAATQKGHTGAGDWTAAIEIDPVGTNTYTINFTGENKLSENYSGWTRIKDGSSGHVINGL